MHEGNEAQGKYGKQDRSIARRCIAVAREPLSKSYGEHWLPARFGIKARLRGHAVACQEVATPSPDCAESPTGRVLKHASAASPKAPTLVQPSLRTMAISFGLRLAFTCFRVRRDPIGLVQRFLIIVHPKSFYFEKCSSKCRIQSSALPWNRNDH